MSSVLLIHSSLPHEKIAGLLKGTGIKAWYPLIGNYEKIVVLKKALRGIAECEEISDMLQNIAADLRRPFYEATAKLGVQYNSIEWWTSVISERNTMTCSLFLHCCYVHLASRWMDGGGDICIITDSNAVIKNIASVAAKKGAKAESNTLFTLKDRPMGIFAEGLLKLVPHLLVLAAARLNRLYHKAITGRYNHPENPDVILHTWVDEKCFGADGQFRDRYFTILPDYYQRNNVRKATFVSFSYRNVTRSIWDAFSFLHTNKEHFIILQDYYCIQELLLHPGLPVPFPAPAQAAQVHISCYCAERR